MKIEWCWSPFTQTNDEDAMGQWSFYRIRCILLKKAFNCFMSHFLDDGTTHIQPNLGKSIASLLQSYRGKSRGGRESPSLFPSLSFFSPAWMDDLDGFITWRVSTAKRRRTWDSDMMFGSVWMIPIKDCVSHYFREPLITSATLTKSPLCPLITWYVRCTTKVMTTSHGKTKLQERIRHYFYYKI